jgi:hypothetical protein
VTQAIQFGWTVLTLIGVSPRESEVANLALSRQRPWRRWSMSARASDPLRSLRTKASAWASSSALLPALENLSTFALFILPPLQPVKDEGSSERQQNLWHLNPAGA